MNRFAVAIASAFTLIAATIAQADPHDLKLASEGEAHHAVVVAESATDRTRQAADELADYLSRITGAEFEVTTGDGQTGLAVGVPSDFPDLDLDAPFRPNEPFARDAYLLRTHADGAYLVGASETAAHLAVWDFLHRLGYRLYFLTDTWQIVPDRPDAHIALDTFEQPDYVTRDAPRGSPWSDDDLWNRWQIRNRVAGSFTLRTGHTYGRIIRDNADAFADHPEYYALVDGERRHAGRTDGRGNIKFCISNAGLRDLVVDWAVEQIEANPQLESLSMDPSDGAHWCECEPCVEMGSVSDRAIILANAVAEAINAIDDQPRYVGLYAYNRHSPPPEVEVHPNVIVSVATSFIRGGYTVEELVEGWAGQGAVLGIRDYHDVFAWSHDRPRQARGGNLDYLTRTIPYFHEQGARFMNSENMDSWGANGLGYWLTPRLLWNTDHADDIEPLIEDFLDNAFGEAKAPMRDFYHLLLRDDTVRSNEDVVARMYRHLDDARQLTTDATVRARLDDLLLYTRYLDLYHDYRAASGDDRQAAFEKVWQHAWRTRDRFMLTTRAICDRDRFRDDSVTVPDAADWGVPEEDNPWKNSDPYTDDELATILAEGIESNEPTVLDFELTEYSDNLVPTDPLNLRAVDPGSEAPSFRGQQTLYTWLADDTVDVDLRVTGGLITHYRDRGNVRLNLFAAKEATLEPVDRDESVPPDGETYSVTLTSPHDGLHRLQWNDGKDRTRIAPADHLPITYPATMDNHVTPVGRWNLYFYVPRGTEVVGGYATTTNGRIVDSAGERVFSFDELEQADYFSVPVEEGRDGALWKFEHVSGARMLLTVPPYLAPTAADLLLPAEVVEQDAGL